MSKGMYASVDGIARRVTKLYTGVNTLQSVGNLPIGATVKLNVAGVPRDFLVIQQGNPNTSIYDTSCNGTWLFLKHPYEVKQFSEEVYSTNYSSSDIRAYLDGTFFGRFDADVQAAIKEVKLPMSSDSLREKGISAKVFLLFGREIGITSYNGGVVNYGTAEILDYFLQGTDEAARNLRVATRENGARIDYWLRGMHLVGEESMANYIANASVSTPGNMAGKDVSLTSGVRPAIILPFEIGVTDGFVDGSVAETYAVVARKIKKAYSGDENGVARLRWTSE